MGIWVRDRSACCCLAAVEVKAQQVKNAVIVPVGAKGGFVPM